jgi:hypothetical protein
MRKVVHGAWILGVAMAVAACASAQGSPISMSVDGAQWSPPTPLGMLPVPAGASPWSDNTDAPMSLGPYIDKFWDASAQAAEKSQYAQWGFVSGGYEGWINPNGSQQLIAIARFATVSGAINAVDDLSSDFADLPAPCTTFAGPVAGAVGSVDPRLDADGNARVEIVVRLGDELIDVHEFTAATPDPAAAKALFLEQVNALKRRT